jgi:hypothetical protein
MRKNTEAEWLLTVNADISQQYSKCCAPESRAVANRSRLQ